MKKATLLIIVSLFYYIGLTQNWKTYKINKDISVELPEKYSVKDTLHQKLISAETKNYGLVQVIKLPNGTIEIANPENEEDLILLYKGIQSGFVNADNREVIEEKVINLGKLKAKQFTARVPFKEDIQLWNCIVLFVNDTTYSFQFLEFEDLRQKTATERNKFFSSIKISDQLTIEDQLTTFQDEYVQHLQSDETRTLKKGRVIGQIATYLLILGGLIYLAMRVLKRKKNIHT